MISKGEEWEEGIVREFGMDTAHIFKMDNQQGPTAQHREHCSMLCGSLGGRGVWGRMDTRIRMAESLCYPSETITTLLIGYTPIQNKKFKRNKKR